MSNSLKELLEKVEVDDFNAVEKTDELIRNTPLIKDSIFDNLPPILDEIVCDKIHQGNRRNRDVVFLSTLTTLSGMFPNVTSNYYSKEIYSNLYLFISGKASSGKGIMSLGIDVLSKVDEDLEDYNNRQKLIYKKAKTLWESYSKKERVNYDEPEQPLEKHLFFSPNTSHASFIDNLKGGIPICMDTEGESMSDNKKQEWGNYSVDLRKAYHHERIIKDRKGDGRVDIKRPKLSVLLSGTLDQLFKVLGTSEDGLFSRFMIYNYSGDREFLSPFSDYTHVDYLNSKKIPEKIFDVVNTYQCGNGIKIVFTETQKDYFFKTFKKVFEKGKLNSNESIDGVVKRHALMAYRIAMIYTILRNAGKPFHSQLFQLSPTDDDVKDSVSVVVSLLSHSRLILNNQNEKKTTLSADKSDIVLKKVMSLDTFTRADVKALIKDDNISDSTMDVTLRKMLSNKLLEKKDKYTYKKVKKNANK